MGLNDKKEGTTLSIFAESKNTPFYSPTETTPISKKKKVTFSLNACPIQFTEDVLEIPDDIKKMQEIFNSIDKPFSGDELLSLPRNDKEWDNLMEMQPLEVKDSQSSRRTRKRKITAHAA